MRESLSLNPRRGALLVALGASAVVGCVHVGNGPQFPFHDSVPIVRAPEQGS